jgi:hypothetical protein
VHGVGPDRDLHVVQLDVAAAQVDRRPRDGDGQSVTARLHRRRGDPERHERCRGGERRAV